MEAWESLVRSFVETQPEGAAHTLESIEPEDAARVLERLPPGIVGPVIERLTPYAAGAILAYLGLDHAPGLLEAMTPRQAALVLQHLDDEKREAILARAPDGRARVSRYLLRYPAETAGGLMEPEVTLIPLALT